MLYLTVEELKTRYPRLASVTGTASGQLAGFIDEASGEADGYLAIAGITVPLSPAPAVLVGKVAALAWGIHLSRNLHEANREGVGELLKDVRDWFGQVAAGKVLLVGSGGALADGGEKVSIWSNASGYAPTFGVGKIEDMRVDPDRVTDEEDAR